MSLNHSAENSALLSVFLPFIICCLFPFFPHKFWPKQKHCNKVSMELTDKMFR